MKDLLASLRLQVDALSKREAAVAALVLTDPQRVLRLPLDKLAVEAGVSQPTVIRFCRSLGCDGLRDFKLQLAANLAGGVPYVHADVEPGDQAVSYGPKVIGAAIAALHAARDTFDADIVERAVALLASSRQLLLFGMGGSGPVALDAQHKFVRLDCPATSTSDPLMARMMVSVMADTDLLLLVSNTGRTIATLELAELARANGVRILALTAPHSPLAAAATIALEIEPAEDVDLYTPMASRIAHLAMIDVLATGLALRRDTDGPARLMRVKEAVRSTRLSGQ
ncbi:SIS domain-containing protein [Roseiterribacter gracilis]|uniref:Transcriptional regulator HexR n=1 Tax=Roseiterribacter gracilis TaxID=2812848 RepID=A0A8S8X903_9PROT|nr:transcriptional regulator HexR [Rhodospirillales bacterium TMPK1]